MFNVVRNEKGFTYFELIMVIAILGILSAVAISRFLNLKEEAVASRNEAATAAIVAAITVKHAELLINNIDYHAADVAAAIDVDGVTFAGAGSGTAGKIQAQWGPEDFVCWNYSDFGANGGHANESDAATISGANPTNDGAAACL